MIFFSSILCENPKYKPAADRLFSALAAHEILYAYIFNTKDIWVRDFMPVKTKSGAFVSFKYEPNYLENKPERKTDFKQDISNELCMDNVTYSDINLDGGNVVFSPSKKKAIISDRVFAENPERNRDGLIQELERLLEAQVIIIPSLKSDMTGHADGMIRFVDENIVIGNKTDTKNGLEQRIKTELKKHNIEVIDFPYFDSRGISAMGSYINFLETDKHIFLPIFGIDVDRKAIMAAGSIFSKALIPVNINEIAKDGGVLNCISWEQ